MASNSVYKKVLIGFSVGLGLALALSPAARERIKKLLLEKLEEIAPAIKEGIEQYLGQISEAVKLGKATFQQKEDELEHMISPESHRTE